MVFLQQKTVEENARIKQLKKCHFSYSRCVICVYICTWVHVNNAADCVLIPYQFKCIISSGATYVSVLMVSVNFKGTSPCLELRPAHDLWWPCDSGMNMLWLREFLQNTEQYGKPHPYHNCIHTIYMVTILVVALSTELIGVIPFCWISRGFLPFTLIFVPVNIWKAYLNGCKCLSNYY